MRDESKFLSFFGAVVMLGPKSPAPPSGHPPVCWSYVKPVKAAGAFWRWVRGARAVFDVGRPPRCGVFGAGSTRSCVHHAVERAPLLLADMRVVCDGGAAGLGRWRRAVEGGGLPRAGSGLGPLLADAVSLRSAVSMAIAFFGVRRASKAARPGLLRCALVASARVRK